MADDAFPIQPRFGGTVTEKEEKAFSAIVQSETDIYQRHYLNGLLKHNNVNVASLHERCALPAVCRLWKGTV